MASPGPSSPQRAKAGRSSLKVLLVEDSHEYPLLVEQMLVEGVEGSVRLMVAETVSEATKLLNEDLPDCVLLDLSLPDAEGLEALAAIQKAAPEVPVVVLSGADDDMRAFRAVQNGAQDYLAKPRADARQLTRAIGIAIERKESQVELTRRALNDSLTGLPNRRLLVDRIEHALVRGERESGSVALLFIDLDDFKAVNDTMGHEAGDIVLAEVGRRLRSVVRGADTIGRYGGDEFVLLREQVAEAAEMSALASRIESALSAPFEVGTNRFQLGSSVGIALGNAPMQAEDLIRTADQAMFRAKEGGSGLEIASTVAASNGSGAGLEQQLSDALGREEFVLHYQPLVDLVTREVFAVEALLRWSHPERGLVGPAEFIPRAEASGLIVPIGGWVLQEVCRCLAEWRSEGRCSDALVMHVNVSAKQLGKGLVESIEQNLRVHRLPAERLCLEITETAVSSDRDRGIETIAALKELGATVALDDFGVGHSSLAALDEYDVDILKIDRSFVAPLGSGLKERRVFAAVLGIARAYELRALAEGIETAEQLRHVSQVGCDAAQGFYFGRPEPAQTIAQKLNTPLGAIERKTARGT
jgi:diguanylate cyclase (GGDEF)-like protein